MGKKTVALSVREQQIFALVAAGKLNKEIAAEIGTTEGGVKQSLRQLFRKLGCRNRVEVALFGVTRYQL